jgi:hypothetical protein
MDRRAAEQIVPILIRAAQEAADTIDIYRRYTAESDIKPYAKAVGEIIFAIDTVLRPLIHEHPDLDPDARSET